MLETLRSEFRKIVEMYCTEPVHRGAMLRALARPGFALHPKALCRAGVLTINIYSTIRGIPNMVAIRAGVAVELYMEAAFMFDNVADREANTSKGLSPSQELALGLTLMSCGALVACEVAHWAGQNGSSLRSLLHFHSSCVNASAGQFLDAYLEKRSCVTMNEALRMTSLKAGSLGRFAAGFGARIATDNQEIIGLCEELGFNLLTYLQLVDDLRDACPAQRPQEDLMRHKKTVPLVFFRNSLPRERRGRSCGIMFSQEGKDISLDVRQAFETSGAGAFGVIVAEIFLNRAKNILTNLQVRLGGTVDSIEYLIKSIELNPQDLSLVT